MKYRSTLYAKALAQASLEAKEKDHEAIVKNFLGLLKKNGDEAELRKIVPEAERIIRRATGKRKMTVQSARALTPAQEKMMKHLSKPEDLIEYGVVPELIAGIRIILDDELQFDGSLRGKVDKLFKNI